jgi:hypothetical protein
VDGWSRFSSKEVSIVDCDVEAREGFDKHWCMLDEPNALHLGRIFSERLDEMEVRRQR